ncbi:hypothetical protein [Metapseudomonas otitidis]|uniref:hypothetical protein n=1 Tax=Metapseudomonas otitidis TaxID=319939 RepID=UPI0013F5CBD7|nr:hypothetical protein [Pseudomonas otitidis]
MAEVDKEKLLRRLAQACVAAHEAHLRSDSEAAYDAWAHLDDEFNANVTPEAVLSLLDENDAKASLIVRLELAEGKWRRSALRIAELANVERQDFLTKLEALRKEARYWRYIREHFQLDGDVFAAFNEWFWAEGPLEDVEAAIDAALLGVSA